jgi:nitrogen fixation/metabolism regulation signal transduction histidine kinase
VYLFLFVISILLALILSDYFTKPLKLIQGKLSKMTLGSPNEPIVWQAEDEIGGLVKEYNRMINELQKSADLLAQSERETAWREMAKQVAHEIKNPLTPMKLSIQHLQNTWHNQADDRDKKIQRISQTLIEQIDALAHIANEFSHFAKMPTGVYEKVDVKQIIENTIELFKESSLTPISFHSDAAQAPVYADKEQLLRVFTNLLKNAIQAIPAKQAGAIEVSIHKKEQDWLLSVRDNGTGINKEAQQKIFTPNFTTKTGGMGLGLAMVKSMVETFGGKIWFETTLTKGSIFYVSLPEYNS